MDIRGGLSGRFCGRWFGHGVHLCGSTQVSLVLLHPEFAFVWSLFPFEMDCGNDGPFVDTEQLRNPEAVLRIHSGSLMTPIADYLTGNTHMLAESIVRFDALQGLQIIEILQRFLYGR